MQLSLEIPTPHLTEFQPLTDFDFGLAHLVLEHKEYREAYQGCLLDNSMYELGEPMSIHHLMEAVKACRPKAIIGPDWMDERTKTLTTCLRFRSELRLHTNRPVGAVVQGKDLAERVRCFREMFAEGFWPICFPFRTPRKEVIDTLYRENYLHPGWWYHLLGLQDMAELRWKYPGFWSIDTGKVFKSYKLDEPEIRGKGRLDILAKLDDWSKKVACWNIAYMRKVMNES